MVLKPLARTLLVTSALTLAACGSTTEVLESEESAGAGGAGGDGPGPSGTSGGGDGGEPPVACVSNEECIDASGQLPTVCREGACVAALSPECTQLLGDVEALADERVIVIGVLAPLSGPAAATGEAQVRAVGLALEELASVAGGLPMGEERAPVVAVACDEIPAAAAAAQHLDDFGARLVVGPTSTASLLAAAPTTIAAGTLVLSPSADGPELSALDDEGLVWQAEPVAAHGTAMASVAARIEAGLGAGTHRIALARGASSRDVAVSDAFIASLVWNGMTGAESAEAGSLLVIDLGEGDPSAAAAAILDHDPDLVVVASGAPVDGLVAAVESGAAPRWLAGPRPEGADSFSSGLAGRLAVVEVGPPAPRDLLDAFDLRYRAAFDGGAPSFAAAEAYDAAWIALHALAAAGDGADGEAIAAAMPRLFGPGAAIEVGPLGAAEGFAALAASASVDLRGVTGSLDADVATGAFPRSHEVLCVEGEGLAPSGLTVDEGGALVGSSACL